MPRRAAEHEGQAVAGGLNGAGNIAGADRPAEAGIREDQVMVNGVLYYTDGMPPHAVEQFRGEFAGAPRVQQELMDLLIRARGYQGQGPYERVTVESEAARIALLRAAEEQAARIAAEALPQECPVCTDDEEVLKKLSCGHSACADCWQQLLTNSIQEGNIEGVVCHDCREPFSEDSLNLVCGDNRDLKVDYNELRARLLVRDARPEAEEIFKQCPRCASGAFVGAAEAVQDIVCPSRQCRANNFRFCSGCLEPSHRGQTCEQVRAAAANPDVETNECKKCPTCKQFVVRERTDGSECNYIRCGNDRCKDLEFCWFCKKTCHKYRHEAHRCVDGHYLDAAVFPKENESLADVLRRLNR